MLLRSFDFKQLPIRFKWSTLLWVPFLFAIVGFIGDIVTTVSGEYDYFNITLLPYINPIQIIHKFLALSPMAIAYGLLNGFYEEFFFLGLMTSVNDKYKWWAAGLFDFDTGFLPYLPGLALGSGNWSCLWTLLLRYV